MGLHVDSETLLNILLALFSGSILCFISTPIIESFAYKVGAIDVPKDARRVHTHPIPRLGGLAIFIAFILSVVLFADVNKQIQGVLFGAVIIVILGAIDDIVALPAWFKLIFQIVAAVIPVLSGVLVTIVTNFNPFSDVPFLQLGWLSYPVTILWIVLITNSVNLIDGLDGLAVGVSAIGSLTMFVIALVMGQNNIAVILAALVGACIGFMPYNLNPAKIFMGDTGALLLGYILATVSVMGFFKFYAIISFAVPLLALGFPIFDTIFSIIRRLLKKQNPMTADRGHFHHRLIDMGLSQKQAVAILYSISAILGLAAVVITTSGEMKAIILVFALCLAVAIGIFVMKELRTESSPGKTSESEKNDPSDGGEKKE